MSDKYFRTCIKFLIAINNSSQMSDNSHGITPTQLYVHFVIYFFRHITMQIGVKKHRISFYAENIAGIITRN